MRSSCPGRPFNIAPWRLDTEPAWIPDGACLIPRDSRARVVHARASSHVRELQRRVAPRLPGCPHLLVRMHVLRRLRRQRLARRLSELRRRIRTPPGPSGRRVATRPVARAAPSIGPTHPDAVHGRRTGGPHRPIEARASVAALSAHPAVRSSRRASRPAGLTTARRDQLFGAPAAIQALISSMFAWSRNGPPSGMRAPAIPAAPSSLRIR